MVAIFRILSFDVVLGALVSGIFASEILEVRLPLAWWIVLPVSVWVVYTLDHLLDAWRLEHNAITPRHQFHFQYRRIIGFVWIVAFSFCLFIAPFWVPYEFWKVAISIGICVSLHLALVWWVGDRIGWQYNKEFGVGVIYAMGVWGGPVSLAEWPIPLEGWFSFLQFFLLALINLYTFSIYEIKVDELDGHTSFVRGIGVNNTRKLVIILGIVILSLGIICLALNPSQWWPQSIFFLMLCLLLIVCFIPKLFKPKERYRHWADGAFLIPMLALYPYLI